MCVCVSVCGWRRVHVRAHWFLHLGWKEGPACWPPDAWNWCFWRWGVAWPPQPPDLGSPVAPSGPWSRAEGQQSEDGQLFVLLLLLYIVWNFFSLAAGCVLASQWNSLERRTFYLLPHFACSTLQISLQTSQRALIRPLSRHSFCRFPHLCGSDQKKHKAKAAVPKAVNRGWIARLPPWGCWINWLFKIAPLNHLWMLHWEKERKKVQQSKPSWLCPFLSSQSILRITSANFSISSLLSRLGHQREDAVLMVWPGQGHIWKWKKSAWGFYDDG